MSGQDDPFELDVQQQRRRVLWQRIYLQTLAALRAVPYEGHFPRGAMSLASIAAEDAAAAVKALDEWEREQGPAVPRPAAPDGGGGDADDSDDHYLGR